MKKVLVDTNVFLRFILADIPKQHKQAEKLFVDAKDGKIVLIVPQIVVFEIHFTLEKYYGFKKSEVIEKLESLVSTKYFSVESKGVFLEAFKIYKRRKVSFVDCFLVAKAKIDNLAIQSFDKELNNLSKLK